MNNELDLTWTPILKELPEDQRERARQIIEKYGEAKPTGFVSELLQILGVQNAYLQTIPAQIRIAGERAKAEMTQSLEGIRALHERARMELNDTVSALARSGTGFANTIETAVATQAATTLKGVGEIKTKIQDEFAKHSYSELTGCLHALDEKAGESLQAAERLCAAAEKYQSHAEQRLNVAVKRNDASLKALKKMNCAGAWVTSIVSCLALIVIVAFTMFLLMRSHYEQILSDKITLSSSTIANNREAFAELAAAGVNLKVQRAAEAGDGSPSRFSIVIDHADAAEMRDYGNGKAGFVFVNGPTPEDELLSLEVRMQEAMNQLREKK